MTYQALDIEQLVATIGRLQNRVRERFPDRGLPDVCDELAGLASKALERAERLARPISLLRVASGFLILIIVSGLAVTLYALSSPDEPMSVTDFVLTLEAGINDLVLIGIAVFFLLSIERRVKRRRTLVAVSELRSIAHIIDMHQLTKDPQHVLNNYQDTLSSPKRTLGKHDLSRYFDYCSEMLSLTGKIAALYVQKFDDPVVLTSVNEVETLTTGLSRKIWQKLMILETGATDRDSGLSEED